MLPSQPFITSDRTSERGAGGVLDGLKHLAAGLAMLTVVALPTLAQSVNWDAPVTSPTPAPDEICEAVVEGGEIVEGIEYGTEVIECNSITEDIITPASILPSFREPYAGSPVSGN